MQVTLQELRDASRALGNLMAERMSARTAFAVGKVIKRVHEELETLESTRMKLIEQYHGVLNKETNQYEFGAEDRKALDAEYETLVKTTVEIPIEKVSLDELADAKLAPGDLLALEWLIAPPAAPAPKKA